MKSGIEAVRSEALGLMRNMDLGTNSPKMRMIRVAMSVCASRSKASLWIHCCKGMVSSLAIAIE